jgi:hypothetical protein
VGIDVITGALHQSGPETIDARGSCRRIGGEQPEEQSRDLALELVTNPIPLGVLCATGDGAIESAQTISEIFCFVRIDAEGNPALAVKTKVHREFEIFSGDFQVFFGIRQYVPLKSGLGNTVVFAFRTKHEKVVGRDRPVAPANFANIFFDQSKSQFARWRGAPLCEMTVKGNTLKGRVFARHLKEFCVESAAVELSPVEIPLIECLGELVEARKCELRHLDGHLVNGCLGRQMVSVRILDVENQDHRRICRQCKCESMC